MDIIDPIIKFVTKIQIYGPILTICISYIVYKIVEKALEKIVISGKSELEKKKRKTVLVIFKSLFKYIIIVIACLIILDLFGVNTSAMIAGLGASAVVLGLAFQDTVKDFISGVTIIFENYFVVGDFVKYNDFSGEIISLGLKSTKIKSFNGEVLTIANRNITEIINISQKKANIIIDIPTAYEEKTSDVEKAIQSILKQIKKLENVFPETDYLGIEELASSSINYRIKVVCKQELKWQIKRESLRIIKEEYEKNNLKIPYTQIEVHNANK